MITHIIRSQRRLSESLLKFSRTCSTVGSVQRQAKRSLYVHNKQLLLSHSNPNFTPSRAHVPRHFASKPSSAYQHQSAVGFVDYEQERANFRLTVPEYYNFATDVIDDWAKKEKVGRGPASGAFWWIDDNGNELRWTFQQLSDKSKRTANLLSGPCHLAAGDRVMVILPRLPQWWLINIACIRIGCTLIAGPTQLHTNNIKQRLLLSGAKVIIADPGTAEKVDADLYNSSSAEHDCLKTKSSDIMQIFFTSGTTGEPKMTEHSHASYGMALVISGRYWLDLVPSDVHWTLSDTGWAKAAWGNLFAPWIQGSCIFIHHSNKFDPVRVLQILERYAISTFCAPPTAYRKLIQENLGEYQLGPVRHYASTGEPLNPEVIDRWLDATGHMICDGYGQTETVLMCASYRCIPCKPGSMGKPAPGMDLRVIDENCDEVEAGQEGEIALKVAPYRPPGLFARYVLSVACGEAVFGARVTWRCCQDDPERTALAFRGDYFLTGDRAVRDEDGYFWFVARSDDVIISSGYRIGPFEVESVLLEHAAVLESAVVSSPDTIRGEVVKAFVVLSKHFKDADRDQLSSELQQHVKTSTAPYKYPRKIEFVDSLPKTVSGKIRRLELRKMEWKDEQSHN